MKLEPGRYLVRAREGGEWLIEVFQTDRGIGPLWHYATESKISSCDDKMPEIIGRVDDVAVPSEPVECCDCGWPSQVKVTIGPCEEPKPPPGYVAANGVKPATGLCRFAVSWADGHFCFIDAADAYEADLIATAQHGTPLAWIATVPEFAGATHETP